MHTVCGHTHCKGKKQLHSAQSRHEESKFVYLFFITDITGIQRNKKMHILLFGDGEA